MLGGVGGSVGSDCDPCSQSRLSRPAGFGIPPTIPGSRAARKIGRSSQGGHGVLVGAILIMKYAAAAAAAAAILDRQDFPFCLRVGRLERARILQHGADKNVPQRGKLPPAVKSLGPAPRRPPDREGVYGGGVRSVGLRPIKYLKKRSGGTTAVSATQPIFFWEIGDDAQIPDFRSKDRAERAPGRRDLQLEAHRTASQSEMPEQEPPCGRAIWCKPQNGEGHLEP